MIYEVNSIEEYLSFLKDEIEKKEIERICEQQCLFLDFFKSEFQIKNEKFFQRYISRFVDKFIKHVKNGIWNDYLSKSYIDNVQKWINQMIDCYAPSHVSKYDLVNESWKSLKKEIIDKEFDESHDEWKNGSYVPLLFRGHGNMDYRLVPNVLRKDGYREVYFIKEMERQEPDHFKSLSFFEKLAKMQHWGCPTRLLDVTSNPLVALYFACTDKKEQKFDGEVFVFVTLSSNMSLSGDLSVSLLSQLIELPKKDQDMLCEHVIGLLKKDKMEFNLKNGVYEDEIIEKLYQRLREEKPLLGRVFDPFMFIEPQFVRGSNITSRIKAQSGSFILPPLLKGKDQIHKMLESMSLKVKIPSKSKSSILRQLDRLCINEYNLYCDLESLSRYLKRTDCS